MKKAVFILSGMFMISPQALAQGLTQSELGQVSGFAELISLVWAYGSNVLIALAAFFIVLGAFFVIASAGNEERITEGKQMIFGSLIAILLVMLSGVLIRTLHKPAEGSTGTLAEVPGVIQNATNILIGLIGAFSVIMLIVSAFLYMSSRGNKEKISRAHRAMRYALYGLITGSLAYGIVNAVIRFLI